MQYLKVIVVVRVGYVVIVDAVLSILSSFNLILYPECQYSEVQHKQDGAEDAISPNERGFGEEVAESNAFVELSK